MISFILVAFDALVAPEVEDMVETVTLATAVAPKNEILLLLADAENTERFPYLISICSVIICKEATPSLPMYVPLDMDDK